MYSLYNNCYLCMEHICLDLESLSSGWAEVKHIEDKLN